MLYIKLPEPAISEKWVTLIILAIFVIWSGYYIWPMFIADVRYYLEQRREKKLERHKHSTGRKYDG